MTVTYNELLYIATVVTVTYNELLYIATVVTVTYAFYDWKQTDNLIHTSKFFNFADTVELVYYRHLGTNHKYPS